MLGLKRDEVAKAGRQRRSCCSFGSSRSLVTGLVYSTGTFGTIPALVGSFVSPPSARLTHLGGQDASQKLAKRLVSFLASEGKTSKTMPPGLQSPLISDSST